MKYLLTYHVGPDRMVELSPEEMREGLGRWAAFDREAVEAGVLIAGEGLQDSANATTVTVEADGARVTTDGPFAESKEQLGGFHLLGCSDLDEALAWASKVPLRPPGHIQVSPIQDFSAHGYESPTPEPVRAAA